MLLSSNIDIMPFKVVLLAKKNQFFFHRDLSVIYQVVGTITYNVKKYIIYRNIKRSLFDTSICKIPSCVLVLRSKQAIFLSEAE